MRIVFATIMLRLGLAFCFAYAAVAGVLAPNAWAAFFPPVVRNLLPTRTLIIIFGIYQIILAVFILFKRNVTWPALIASLTLLLITFLNLQAFETVFRDVGLAMAALSLFAMGKLRI